MLGLKLDDCLDGVEGLTQPGVSDTPPAAYCRSLMALRPRPKMPQVLVKESNAAKEFRHLARSETTTQASCVDDVHDLINKALTHPHTDVASGSET